MTQHNLLKHIRLVVVCVGSLLVMLLFSACSGIATTGGAGSNGTITGSVVSVNASAHSILLNVNGQQMTVSGLTDQQISALQSQIGKMYNIQVQSTGNNSYSINNGTDPVEENAGTPEPGTTPENTNNNNTPTSNPGNGVSVPGEISFIGKVQSYSNGTLVTSLPGNQSLTLSVVNGQTELKDMAAPQVGQLIKVDALTNTNGGFTASKIEATDAGDLQDSVKMNTVDYKGMTTQAVGANGALSIKVGSNSYSFTINGNTQVKDFVNAQSIGANQSVKVEVLYNGGSNIVQKVENNNN